jgi:predicted RNA-binding protein with RPS1 domain
MRDRIGETFAGTIAAVVPFGVFVALDEVYVEGLVHVSELGEDYFQYDSTRHQMLGERTGKRYRLGDRLQVKLVKADLETGRIDFVLADAAEAAFVTACSRCGDCRRACLKRVIGQGDGGFRALDFLVRECIFCAAPCPTAAIDLGQSSDAS